MKLLTSFLVIFNCLVTLWAMRGEKSKAALIGFIEMEITYILCLVVIWQVVN